MSQSVFSDCMFTTLHWAEQTRLIITNSNLYNRLATQLPWVQFTPSLSDVSISRLWLYVYYPTLGRINTVDYNQLKLVQWISYAATVSTVYSTTSVMPHSVVSDCMFTTLHWVEYTPLIIINSNLYNRLTTHLPRVQFTQSPSEVSTSRFWLYVYYPTLGRINTVDYTPTLGRINTVDYDQLKLIQ